MDTRTKRWIALAIAAVVTLAFVLLLTGPARASDGTPGTVTVTAQAKAIEVRSQGGAHCWSFDARQLIPSNAGKTRAIPKMSTVWCSGRYMRKVTSLVYMHCGNLGGFYSFDRCTKHHGSAGYSYLGAGGDWWYHWVINSISTFTLTVDLEIRYYANGGVTGTWSWQ